MQPISSRDLCIRPFRKSDGPQLVAAALEPDELKLTRLEIVAPEDNVPSRRVAEKVGAVFECIARNRVMVHGKPQNAAVYALVPEQCGL